MPDSSTVYRALLFYTLLCTSAASPISDLWQIHIDESPAPSPQDGPPLSAGAIRNKAYLPRELAAIFGSYVVVVIIVSAAILTIGHRLRRSAQTSPRTLAMEMLNPQPERGIGKLQTAVQANPWDPSPITPAQGKREWPSPVKSALGHSWGSIRKHKQQDSMQSSLVTFHENVIEEDRNKNEIELDRLYAAVAQHEEQKARTSSQTTLTNPPLSPLAQNPPELQHLRYATTQEEPISPPPQQVTFPSRAATASPGRNGPRFTKPSPISVHSTQSQEDSRASSGSFSKKRGGVRNLPISPPMGSPDMVPDNMRRYGESEPLSPRFFNPGPPPTPPNNPNNRAETVGWEPQIPPSPRPGSFRSIISPRRENFGHIASPLRENFGGLASPREGKLENLASNQGHFSPAIRTSRSFFPPNDNSSRSSSIDSSISSTPPQQLQNVDPNQGPSISISAPPTKSKRPPKPAALALNSQSAFNNSINSLPLRSAPLPLRAMGGNHDRPQSIIQSTTLERKPERMLRAPGTGVPSTPYSPYMPFTPLTPMTPSRLVTREERKRKEKEAGRRVATIEDAVPEEEELWGDGY